MAEPQRTPRYRVIQEIGRGGMGVVSVVHDAVRGEDVAMKRIALPDADAAVRFKREFRVMEGLHHPSLVRLHELGSDDHGLYFTMEWVRGLALASWCRPGLDPDAPATTQPELSPLARTGARSGIGPTDRVRGMTSPAGFREALARLTAVLPQLLDALAFLHERGIVHRDLKSSNVMVTAEGGLKLLDFGVLSELGRRPDRDGPQGTVGYIAPEVLRGDPAEPASDLYSLGVMMFDVLAARPLFDGAPLDVLLAHLDATPPRLSDVARDAPRALVEACAALLAKTPGERPTIDDLRAALGAPRTRRASGRPPADHADEPLGRDEEKRTLAAALAAAERGEAAWVSIAGPSGSGKTTLGQWIAGEALRRDARVLRGRGRPTERLPFNAVDGAIDELALALRDEPRGDDAALQEDLAIASSAFPILATCCTDGAPVSSGRARALVFDALVRVIGRAAQEHVVVLFVDDLQWADDDSRAVLEHLLDAAPRRVLVVTTLRDDMEAPAATRVLLAREGVTRVALGPLDDAVLAAIVARFARREGAELGTDTVNRAVVACVGRPFLAEVSARALARDRDAEVGERGVTAAMLAPVLDAHAPLLALLVAADAPLDRAALAELRATHVGAIEDAVGELSRAGVTRSAGGRGRVTLYHDVVRAAAADAIGTAALAAAHGALADWLAPRPDARPEQRVVHLLHAGREEEAAALARAAAAHAFDQRAYALAADMLEIALRRPGADRVSLLRTRAATLERAAQYPAAARCWAEVAAAEQGEDALDAALCEASALIASQDMAAGMARLREALSMAGLPPMKRSKLKEVAAGLRFLAGPRRLTLPRQQADAAELRRCDRELRAAFLVVYLDPLTGTRFMQRVRDRAVRAGAREVAAACDWSFAYYALFLSPRRGPVPLADRYVASATELTGELTSDRTMTMADFVAGLAAERRGDWAAATLLYDRALVSAERLGFGTTEHALVLMNRAQVELYAQRLHGVAQQLARMRALSRSSPQTTLATYADIIGFFSLNYQGQFEQARAMRDDVVRRLEAGGETRLGHAVRLVGCSVAVHEDEPGAHLRFRRDLAAAKRFGATRYMRLGVVLALGAVVEANALRRGEPGASYDAVMRMARRSLDAPPFMVGVAYRAMAYAEDALGRADRARELLERAVDEAIARAQPVDAAIARFQLGRRLGGARGGALVAEAIAQATAAGASAAALEEDAGGRRERAR